jgi:ferric-dicitrate binding protein FerR (iron transport regulator)
MNRAKTVIEAVAGLWHRLCRALRGGGRSRADVGHTPASTEHPSVQAAPPPPAPSAQLESAKILRFPAPPPAAAAPVEPLRHQPEKDAAEERKIERGRRWQTLALLSAATGAAVLALSALLIFEWKVPLMRDWLAALASKPQTSRFGIGSFVEFDADTRLRLNADDNPCHVWMSAGTATFDIAACPTEAVLVSSPLAIARVERDAQFTLSIAAVTSVSVHKGEIYLLVPRTGMATKVRHGQKAVISPDAPWSVLVGDLAADADPLGERRGGRRLEGRGMRLARVGAHRSPARPQRLAERRAHDASEPAATRSAVDLAPTEDAAGRC